jgi:hypothetical protein
MPDVEAELRGGVFQEILRRVVAFLDQRQDLCGPVVDRDGVSDHESVNSYVKFGHLAQMPFAGEERG